MIGARLRSVWKVVNEGGGGGGGGGAEGGMSSESQFKIKL